MVIMFFYFMLKGWIGYFTNGHTHKAWNPSNDNATIFTAKYKDAGTLISNAWAEAQSVWNK